MRFFWSLLIDAYEREDATPQQKDDAVLAICQLHKELNAHHGGEWEGQEPDKILRVCVAEIHRWAGASEEVATGVKKGDLASVLDDGIRFAEDRESVYPLSDDDEIIQWLFDGIMDVDDATHRNCAIALGSLLQWACSIDDRTSIVIRHFPKLHNALAEVFTRTADEHRSTQYELAEIHEVACILATMPSLFRDWCTKWWGKDCAHTIDRYGMHNMSCGESTMCEIVFLVLESSLDSPWTLYDLLGNGALAVANHYARYSVTRESAHHAAVFNRILEIFPKWRQQYRKWTYNGDQGNPTADLGRSIHPKAERAGCEYVFEEED